MSDLRRVLPSIIQIDWCDLVFAESAAVLLSIERSESTREMLASAEIGLRIVDNSYIYAYTRMDNYVRAIVAEYPACDVKRTSLELLEIPY